MFGEPEEIITSEIYLIRDKKVMLDEDLAQLYNVPTGVLNQAVKRNKNRFPDDFMLQVPKKEFDILMNLSRNMIIQNQEKQ